MPAAGTFEASSLWNAPRPLNEPLTCSDSSFNASGAVTPSEPAASSMTGVRRTCGRIRPQAASTSVREIIGLLRFSSPVIGGGVPEGDGGVMGKGALMTPPPCTTRHLPR